MAKKPHTHKRKPGKNSGKNRKKERGVDSPTRRTSDGEWFERLVAVMAVLRSPKGCPWDREQTHTTLRPYLIEETYEVLDAMDRGDDEQFADEMGDLLLQVIFHAQIAREECRFAVSDVIRSVHDKLIRRHPHVFGDVTVRDSNEVLRNWEQIKAEERRAKAGKSQVGNLNGAAAKKSILDGVPRGLPGTMEGFQLTRKAARAGFDWENAQGVFEKVEEEIRELRAASASESATAQEDELGDLLFATVNLARFLKIDPEIALKKANRKFTNRFNAMEEVAERNGQDFAGLPREEKESLWNQVKVAERGSRLPSNQAPATGRAAK